VAPTAAAKKRYSETKKEQSGEAKTCRTGGGSKFASGNS